MADTKKIYGVYFAEDKEDPFDVIMRILVKNNLKEGFSDAVQKRAKGEISGIDFLYAKSKTLALGDLTREDFISSAQKQLRLNADVANNLYSDVQSMLLPLTVKEKIGQSQKSENLENFVPKLKPPLEVEKILQQREKDLLKEKVIGPIENNNSFEDSAVAEKIKKPPVPKIPTKSKLPKNIADTATDEIKKPEIKKSSKPDSYREPIE